MVLKSRRFWSALLGLFAIVFASLNPAMQPHLDSLVPGILAIIGILIGGYSIEDYAIAKAHGVRASQYSVNPQSVSRAFEPYETK